MIAELPNCRIAELNRRSLRQALLVAVAALFAVSAFAATPTLKIKLAHAGDEGEEKRKAQVERLADQYDLKKYTLTRDIVIERGAMNHSSPVLTLNLRFLDNDDLALSAYVHEQGHWVLMERHRMDLRPMIGDLKRAFPNLDFNWPQGDGEPLTTYAHIAVCMLEWQAMEELVGTDRARKVIDWKRGDHYTDVYRTIVGQRPQVEGIMKRYGIKW